MTSFRLVTEDRNLTMAGGRAVWSSAPPPCRDRHRLGPSTEQHSFPGGGAGGGRPASQEELIKTAPPPGAAIADRKKLSDPRDNLTPPHGPLADVAQEAGQLGGCMWASASGCRLEDGEGRPGKWDAGVAGTPAGKAPPSPLPRSLPGPFLPSPVPL